MALIIKDTNSITAGTNTAISTSYDHLYLMPGVLLASTDGFGIVVNSNVNDVSVKIDGYLTSNNVAFLSNGLRSILTVGTTGIVTSLNSSSAGGGVNLQAGDSDLVNHGEISAPETMAVFLAAGNNEVINTGLISGTAGVVFFDAFSNNRLVNYGDILATGSFDFNLQNYEGVGVLMVSPDSSIYNGLGARITTTAPGGSGISVGASAGGLMLENHGEIVVQGGTAIEILTAGANDETKLINSGIVSGSQAVSAGNGIEIIHNSGSFHGDVDLGANNDKYTASGSGQVINGAVLGGDGYDILLGADMDDTFYGGTDSDTIRGGAGDDSLYGGADFDFLLGGTGDDMIEGEGSIDLILGGAGDDQLFGGSGDDTIRGGGGEDNIYGDLDDDLLYGADGEDLIYGGDGNDTLYGNADADRLFGVLGADNLFGGQGDDVAYGGGDNDTVFGNAGDDLLSGDNGRDDLFGGSGDDELNGGNGVDRLYGGSGDDLLIGGAGKDELFGGHGNDTLVGGSLADEMTGGRGADVFQFNSVNEAGTTNNSADVITDFVAGEDLIDLSGLNAGTLAFVGTGGFVGGGTGSVGYSSGGGATSVLVDGNGDGTLDMVILVIGAGSVTADDFVL